MAAAVRPASRVARCAAVPFANAREAVGEIAPGVRVVGLTKGQFSLLDLIAAVLDQIGSADVTVSTWTPGKREMEAVADLLDGGNITRFRLLVDRSFVTRHPEYVARIHAAFGAETIRQTRTHAKFALIAAGSYHITIRTSMNFNRNPRFEQFDLDDDAAIYDFFETAVRELYDTLPAGLDVPSPLVVRHFAGVTMGKLFRMEEHNPLLNNGEQSANKNAVEKRPKRKSIWAQAEGARPDGHSGEDGRDNRRSGRQKSQWKAPSRKDAVGDSDNG